MRDLRYRFTRIEGMLREGEEVEITKRKRIIARLTPTRQKPAERPDFLERLRRIYGEKKLKVSGAELLRQERGRK